MQKEFLLSTACERPRGSRVDEYCASTLRIAEFCLSLSLSLSVCVSPCLCLCVSVLLRAASKLFCCHVSSERINSIKERQNRAACVYSERAVACLSVCVSVRQANPFRYSDTCQDQISRTPLILHDHFLTL